MKYDIYINGSIGYPFSASFIQGELAKVGDSPCTVYISSLGGSVVDALQIRQMFLEHGNVTVHLHGFVASAATIIAMGAKRIVMGEFALLLVHRCSNWIDEWGTMNAEEIAQTIQKLEASKNALETIDQTVVNIYAARCGKKVEDIAGWMKDADWLNADTCMEYGLIDEIIKDEQSIALTDCIKGQILACGLPVPSVQENKEHRSIMDAIRAFFKDKTIVANPPVNQPTNTETLYIMNTDFKNVLAALQVDGIEQSQNTVVLSVEQMTALDNHLSALAQEKETLTNENTSLREQVNDLTTQVENLQQADGAETSHIEESVVDESKETHYAQRARASYERLKHLN